jgi:short-subunit dehydrogenase
MENSTSEKIVLVTGANQGIGYQVVKQLSTKYPHYRVLLGSRNSQRGEEAAVELLRETGASIEVLTIDVTDDASSEYSFTCFIYPQLAGNLCLQGLY